MKLQDSEKTCELCGTAFWDKSRHHNMRFCCQTCCKKAWNAANAAKLKADKQKFYEDNKQKIIERIGQWQKDNPDKVAKNRKKYKNKYKTGELKLSAIERLKHSLRTRVTDVLNGRLKGGSAVRDLGCTPQELMAHLETGFHSNPRTGEAMTWDNYGKYGWHIDHIEPLAKFDLSDPEQFKKVCHYTNLQPLWWFENLEKRDLDYHDKKLEGK